MNKATNCGLGSKVNAMKVDCRGTSVGIFVVDTLTRYQLLTTVIPNQSSSGYTRARALLNRCQREHRDQAATRCEKDHARNSEMNRLDDQDRAQPSAGKRGSHGKDGRGSKLTDDLRSEPRAYDRYNRESSASSWTRSALKPAPGAQSIGLG